MSAASHYMTAEIIDRDPNLWRVKCGCGVRYLGATYEVAEDKWREHVHDATGNAPKPMGDTSITRWAP